MNPLKSYSLAQLENWAEYKLILVQAPAGFGKTTLLLDWLRLSEVQSSWLTIDERDNSPSRFIHALVRAVRNLNPQSAEKRDTPEACDPLDPESSVLFF